MDHQLGRTWYRSYNLTTFFTKKSFHCCPSFSEQIPVHPLSQYLKTLLLGHPGNNLNKDTVEAKQINFFSLTSLEKFNFLWD